MTKCLAAIITKHQFLITCLNIHKRSGLFVELAFIQPIKVILKSFQKALIGCEKASPPKKPLWFWTCK